MTKEELIRYGNDYYRDLVNACCGVEEKHKEFVRESIKALEQEPCEVEATKLQQAYNKGFEDCKQAVLDMATTIQTDDFSGNEVIEVVDIDDIKALPPITQKSSEDMPCITPEEMQECKDIVKKYTPKQEPCDDAISREAVREILAKYHLGESRIAEELNELPPVTPQQKYGKWITTRTFMHDGEYYCDRCKCDAPNNEKWDFCPNCGCRMVEPQESEDKEWQETK